MDIQLRPLICRSPLLPGESLNSFLLRIQELNDYPVSLFQELISGGKYVRMTAPRYAETFRRLALLTELAPEELYHASIHAFAPLLNRIRYNYQQCDSLELAPDDVRPLIADFARQKSLRDVTHAQCCSLCLQEGRYHRLAWYPKMVTVCLRHQCLLLNSCPGCGNKIAMQQILTALCPTCGVDLAQWPVIPLKNPLGIFSQQLTQAALGIVGIPSQPWPYTLPTEHIAALVDVAEYFSGRSFCNAEWEQLQSELAPPKVLLDWHIAFPRWNESIKEIRYQSSLPTWSYHTQLHPWNILTNWPQGFHRYMGTNENLPRWRVVGLAATLSNFYCNPEHRWNGPEYQFIREAYIEHIAQQYVMSSAVARSKVCQLIPDLPAKMANWTVGLASEYLQVGPATIARLVKAGQLEGEGFWSQENRHYKFVKSASVIALKERWDAGCSLATVVEWLGLSEEIVVEMAERDFFKAVRGPITDGSQRWLFDRSEVEKWLAQVLIMLTRTNERFADAVTLPEAARILNSLGLKSVDIWERIVERRLPGFCPLGTGNLKPVFLSGADLRRHINYVKQERHLLNYHEIALRFKVKSTVVARWIDNGLLTPSLKIGAAEYFTQAEVDDFCANHIFTEQAAEILEVDILTVQTWARMGRLQPLAGPEIDGGHRYLFRRSDLEALRPAQRLSAPQKAKQLGISRSQLVQWIKQGKVKPISGPGIDGCGRYLFVGEASHGEASGATTC